jgi:hypothetical protein
MAQRQSADRSRAAGSAAGLQSSIPTGHPDQPLNRRRALRILGSLAGAAAGAAALSAARPDKASANGPTLFTSNTSATPVTAENTAGFVALLATGSGGGSSYATVSAQNSGTDGVAVYGESDASGAYAVQGSSLFGYGVVGYGGTASVYGYTNSSNGIGVLGTNSSDSNPAIQGTNYAKGPGLQATTTTAANGHPAVLGVNGGAGPGVQGFSSGTGSIGISGGSDIGVGFWGTANGSGVGVLGSSISGTGVWGQSQSYFAGVFSGPVLVQGNFSVTGAKSAVVRGADGGLKRMYSVESPESWFEDFGSGQLSSGSATVALEPGFAAVVKADQYHVYLTPQGESKGWLFVSNKTSGGFTVKEAGGGASSIAFDYRIVAKRKDIEGARLEHVDEPPTLPDSFKTPPTAPKMPDLPAMPRPGG